MKRAVVHFFLKEDPAVFMSLYILNMGRHAKGGKKTSNKDGITCIVKHHTDYTQIKIIKSIKDNGRGFLLCMKMTIVNKSLVNTP